MLHSERKRMAGIDAREAAGESLWTREVPAAAREKLIYFLEAIFSESFGVAPEWDRVHREVILARGLRSLTGVSNSVDDVKAAIRRGVLDMLGDILEAVVIRLESDQGGTRVEAFTRYANGILASYRVSAELVAGKIVEFESREMHQEVVVPALLLFGGDQKFAGAERAYQDALREVATDAGAADAITDAATCLQEVLVALGCDGNALGPLVRDARKRGMLGATDTKLASGIGDLIDWVSSDRSGNGDAHNANPASREDAWLTIHVVGALALRLAVGTPRA